MSTNKLTSEISEIKEDLIFLEEEERVLNKTLYLREDIVDNFIKGGLPEKVGEIRVINELLNSMDNQVLSRSDKRLKHTQNENDKDVTEIIKNILLETSTMVNVNDAPRDLDVVIELKDSEVVSGEDKIEYEELNIDDFIKE